MAGAWLAGTSRARGRDSRLTMAIAIGAALVLSACGDGSTAPARSSTVPRPGASSGKAGEPTAAQLAEAKRLLDPDHAPVPPTPAQIACVARVVVLDPTVDAIANDMAQQDVDLREVVMTDYLKCAYNFVLDLYMRSAPARLSSEEKACVRSKLTQLTVKHLSEVMVGDPEAGDAGARLIQACET